MPVHLAPHTAVATCNQRLGSRVDTSSYLPFIDELKQALVKRDSSQVKLMLDGAASAKCHDLVPASAVQRLGAFFTPSHMALKLVNQLTVASWKTAVFLDPACGAADLLLPIASRLQIRKKLSSTLRAWNQQLIGYDVSAEFVKAARLRITLLAIRRGSKCDDSPARLAALLTNIRVADGLAEAPGYGRCTHVVMNPPFGQVTIDRAAWRDGDSTAAAVFVERAVSFTSPNTEIVALLPEVLRCGSSYQSWRARVAGSAKASTPVSLGRFSQRADIDVFLQRFTKIETRKLKLPARKGPTANTLERQFELRIGPVVPYRDKEVGVWRRFVDVRSTKAWEDLQRISKVRRFSGRVFSPPFVLIRRTSRPGDPCRAVGTLVLGARKVAVENHFIVAIPKRGGIRLCRKLMRSLRDKKTTTRLNRSMRCRHLTTKAIQKLPSV